MTKSILVGGINSCFHDNMGSNLVGEEGVGGRGRIFFLKLKKKNCP